MGDELRARSWLRFVPLPRIIPATILFVVGCTLVLIVEPGSVVWWGLLAMNAATAVEAHLVARELLRDIERPRP